MRRRLLICAVLAALAATVATSASGSPPASRETASDTSLGHVRAMWAWYWKDDDELADWAAANDFNRVYLFCEGGFSRKVKRAIAALSDRGIAVEALAGENEWGLRPQGMLDFVRKTNAYQRHAAPEDRLAGIHLDVESFDSKLFRRQPERVLRRYLEVLKLAQRQSTLPIGWDIPFWFDGEHVDGHPYLDRLIAAADRITIMSYRDSAQGILDVARRELRLGKRHGTPITLGAETGDYKPASITFFQEGRAALEAALAAIGRRQAGDPAFRGVAVHHYGALRVLAP
jgi:hypothetical protein